MRDLLRAYFSRRTLVSLYNLFFTLSRKLLTSFPLSLIKPKSNDGDIAVAESESLPLLDLSKPSSPISFPIKSLQDLKSRSYFNSFHFQFNRSTVPLRRNSDDLPNRPRVLICHDMKGGYVDDKWIQGCENDAGFAIWHWYLMDIFVYFSHSLVTLPPPCWINTAHRHGVKVLGTFITEWDEGKATCKDMLATKDSAQMYAERLAELATSLGFDGWLINIENEIDEEQVSNLKEFVSHLTKVLHLSTPGALVIWYDSVTVNGNLQWQDQLNEMNKPFFDLCDGIFMNYTWQESYPKLSAEAAGDRKFDFYMGIDVFGRGSFGGGKWNVNAALDLLKRNNVSAALFAPGWVYETAQPPNFHTAQNKWWSRVEKSWGIVQTYPQVLPFYSDFNQGFGYHISLEGRQLSDAPWYNISCQSLQPLLEFNEDNKDIIQVTVDAREASYNGGGNIAFRGRLEGDAYFTTRLFKPHLQLSSSPITFSYSVKSDGASKLGILLSFSSPSNETKSILLTPQEAIPRKFSDMFLQNLATSVQAVLEWTVHETSLVMDGHILTEISAFCYKPENSTERAEYVALLGHISIKDHVEYQQKPDSLPPASLWEIEAHNIELVPGDSGSKILRVKLEWRHKHPEDSSVYTRYHVYAENVKSSDLRLRKVLEQPRSETVFLGIAHVPAYYVAELVVDSDVKGVRFVVQACAEDGSSGKLDDSPNLLVELEGLSSTMS
ncbi:Cytosolic endo-beta-N-acetylglucosaminidase 2 [Cardamine amara subsp. amara]|uniref:mannosyl-glycoprotein endo-beta-N-acetylglucosaminidase n=1 Tax=Cardamine amara subsp. amara TaxID=228776 RepID=A0ABD0YZK3_CARAN